MPLVDLHLNVISVALPADVRSLLREAKRRISRFQRDYRIPGFVPSHFPDTYHVLRALAASDELPGYCFCEWGSGFGVVTCLAAMLGFTASGIEIENDLVEEAQQLAADFDLPAEFTAGSFIPQGMDLPAKDYAWLSTLESTEPLDSASAPENSDLIFAYPWPDEEVVIAELFEHHAAEGAILVTHHEMEATRVRKKAPTRRQLGSR